jgi:SAM-dependent methyltransferase
MDILNKLPEERFTDVDDLLAFVSIYDDEDRTRTYREMLRRHRDLIEDKVVVEAGCGLGVFSAEMAALGARKVYAVEVNPLLHNLAEENTRKHAAVTVVRGDVRSFQPPEPVDLLVHDFFGQMLYDEELYVLGSLRFAPSRVLPDRALLRYGWARDASFCDDVVTPAVLRELHGVLVSGLFDDEGRLRFYRTAAEWLYPGGITTAHNDLSGVGRASDVLYFGIEIYDGEHLVGRSGCASNWSYVFTPRAGDRFDVGYEWNGRFMETTFGWQATASGAEHEGGDG